jgi:hypothetical protein
MAVIAPVVKDISTRDGSVISVTWSALTTTNTSGSPIPASEWADRTIQFAGTFGAGGTVKLQGTLDADPLSSNYVDLADPQGNAISKTALSIEAVLELVQWVKPVVTAGDGTTSINATMLLRRQNPLRT